MINILRKEPLLKKIILITTLVAIVLYGVFFIFQYDNLKGIYIEQMKMNNRIVGALTHKYPEEELEIVKALYGDNDQYEDLGSEVLGKFGYSEDYNMEENINFQQHLKYFLVNILIHFVGVIVLVLLIMSYFMRKIYTKLFKLNGYIEKLTQEDFSIREDTLEEGVFNKIYFDLNKLSRTLRKQVNSLDTEKESIKELVTDISHQLKTPLAALKLYNTILLEEEIDEEERVEFLTTNDRSINKLHNLIDSLVNISRLEASMINIKREDKSIKNTLKKSIEDVAVKAKQKNISIKLIDFEDKIIPHDSKWTGESIFNILENGVKYTNEGGSISVHVEETINFLRVNIKDTGMGIKTSEINNIFKRFYRSEKVEDIEGSGVGLYLSRKIVEAQGGNIIVSSMLGEGSTFSIFLTKL